MGPERQPGENVETFRRKVIVYFIRQRKNHFHYGRFVISSRARKTGRWAEAAAQARHASADTSKIGLANMLGARTQFGRLERSAMPPLRPKGGAEQTGIEPARVPSSTRATAEDIAEAIKFCQCLKFLFHPCPLVGR